MPDKINRREVLYAALASAAISASGSIASAHPQANAVGPYLELRVASKPGELPFTVEEFGADGKSVGAIRCEDERGLRLFLARTAKDLTAPKQIRLVVADGATLERVWSAVKGCRAGRFKQIRYYGCIPPGCGIPAGGMSVLSAPGVPAPASNQVRHKGTLYEWEALDKILSDNSTKC